MQNSKKAIKKYFKHIEYFNHSSIQNEMAQIGNRSRLIGFERNPLHKKMLEDILKNDDQLVDFISKILVKNIETWYLSNPKQREKRDTYLAYKRIEKQKPDYLQKKEEKTLNNVCKALQNSCIEYEKHLRKDINPKKYKQIRDKIFVLQKLNAILQTNVSQKIKIEQFERVFNKPKNKYILNKNQDAAGIRFLKNIGHILTFGVISKLKNNTFKFWKSKSQILTNTIQKNLNEASTFKIK